jgi:hypothetical protein
MSSGFVRSKGFMKKKCLAQVTSVLLAAVAQVLPTLFFSQTGFLDVKSISASQRDPSKVLGYNNLALESGVCQYEPPPTINGPSRTGGTGGRYILCS